jgi:hypothetical protein
MGRRQSPTPNLSWLCKTLTQSMILIVIRLFILPLSFIPVFFVGQSESGVFSSRIYNPPNFIVATGYIGCSLSTLPSPNLLTPGP